MGDGTMKSRLEAGMRTIRSLAAISAIALALTACATANEEAAVTRVDYKACLATSEDFIEDGSVADQALEGLQRAVLKQGVAYKVVNSPADASTPSYVAGLKLLVSSGCDLVMATTHRMAAATYRVAKANPKVDFVLVDAALTTSGFKPASLANVRELRFDAHSAAFLAGYLAAATTQTNTVGAFGGAPVKEVTDVLAGFKLGVTRFNEQNQKAVVVVGLAGDDPARWRFTSTWANPKQQAALAYQLVEAGADVIFAYTGSTTLLPDAVGGAATDGPKFIGIDSDWFNLEANAEVASSILASITKNIAPAVESTIISALAEKFTGGESGRYLATLANRGVSLTEPHTLSYPSGVEQALSEIVAEIVEGTLVVDSSPNSK
jgi:basic membrane protein A